MHDIEQHFERFLILNRNRKGSISTEELQKGLVNPNWESFDETTLHMLVGMFDQEREGYLTLDGFACLWNYLEDWRAAFSEFDRDNSGKISVAEMRQALVAFGCNIQEEETIEKIVKKFSNHGESVNFDEFIQISILINRYTQTFTKYDEDKDGSVKLDQDMLVSMCFEAQ